MATLQTLETSATGDVPPRSSCQTQFVAGLKKPSIVLGLWPRAAHNWLRILARKDPQRHNRMSAWIVDLIELIYHVGPQKADISDKQRCLYVAGFADQRRFDRANGLIDGSVVEEALDRFGIPWFLLILVTNCHVPAVMAPLMAFARREATQSGYRPR